MLLSPSPPSAQSLSPSLYSGENPVNCSAVLIAVNTNTGLLRRVLAEAILKPAVEPTAAVEDVAEAVASHLPALDVDTLTEAGT